MSTIKIRLKKSPIGAKENHKRTVQALGFKKVGQVIEKNDDPAIRGMLAHINHMVEIVD
ncbi:MAG: 50S ribosomal protein L30 [Tissierellia bacterium]|nr:50S ribosomal protein L30 [Tissierellia bacterium]